MKGSNESRCHTCRRQRLRCDASKPTCNKCATRGVECLGYGAQPILWVQPQTQTPAESRGKAPAYYNEPKYRGDGSSSSSSTEDHAIRVATGKKRGRPRLVLMAQEADEQCTDRQIQIRRHLPKSNEATGRIWTPQTRNLNPAGYDADRLAIHCINYYNYYICPDLVLLDNPANRHRLPVEYWAYFPEMMLNMIIGAALTTQVIRSKAGQGLLTYRDKRNADEELKRHHLGTVSHPSMPTIYKCQRNTLKFLNAELKSPQARYSDAVLTLVISLMRCEIQQSAFGAWPAHLEAARTIIAHRGGFTALADAERDDLHYILSDFMLVDVMSTAMTPTGLLDAKTVNKQLEYIPKLSTFYKDGLESGFPCPNELVECLIRINYARSLNSVPLGDSSHVNALAEELIHKIASFWPKAWADKQYRDSTKHLPISSPSQCSSDSETIVNDGYSPSTDVANATLTLPVITSSSAVSASLASDLKGSWEDLAKAFQATILLHCLQTLFLFRETPPRVPGIVLGLEMRDEFAITNAVMLRDHALKMLLSAIHRLWDVEPKDPASWCGKFLMWPMFVAGMELNSSPEMTGERLFLCKSLSKLCDYLGDLSPLDAAAMLGATYCRSQKAAAMGCIEYGPWVDRISWAGVKGLFFI
ncbi:Zn(2)-C6 fungal-type DNA-binding domain-containing protein [Penicillium cataractarum]|uniref:Zn(2)-C6 fungal-type DNA-binding domain-containing protein n=1 Tax=Penicillium cataractarum TaxID=2100454 RepID=A0A9W9V7G8_9EURO|nr:Zn(2)-C6 fungal-type DNA-binding domain-containing protein [Penicillium cataractarum]KAJ5370419.1 Zn(2)-C6 fungal-type DNA-binding domain-containing protein [Penicillium cataractarum]